MPEYKLRDKFDRTSELIYYTKSFLVVVIGWQRYDIFFVSTLNIVIDSRFACLRMLQSAVDVVEFAILDKLGSCLFEPEGNVLCNA